MKLTSAIIMFMLAIATLVIGVLAAQTQSINMEGTINFNIADRSLYLKNATLDCGEGNERPLNITPGYINENIVIKIDDQTLYNTTFIINFDIINTTENSYYAVETPILDQEIEGLVSASVTGTIDPTAITEFDDQSNPIITPETEISGRIALKISAPSVASLDLNKITIIINQVQLLEGFEFRQTSDTTAELVSYTGSETDLYIPESYSVLNGQYIVGNDITVTSIADAMPNTAMGGGYLQDTGAFYSVRNSLNSVVLPSTLEKIGAYAFSNCSLITQIDIPEGIKIIGDWAFGECDNLMDISIPNSVTSIGEQAFRTMSDRNYNVYENGKYLGNETNPYIYLVGAVDSSADTFSIHPNCKFVTGSASNITAITIPSSVIEIGSNVFRFSGASLKEIIFEPNSSLTKIGERAFYGCSALSTIEFPSTLTSIGGFAFSGCSSLSAIEFPSTLTSIGINAFYNCTSLQTVDFNNCKITSIPFNVFNGCTVLTTTTIPETVTSIERGAFGSCTNLQYNTDGEGKYLGSASNPYFALIDTQTESMTSITINSNCKIIAADVFSYCSNLQTVDFGTNSQLQTIGDSAFLNCHSLITITIPETVTSIEIGAFDGCTNLQYNYDGEGKYLGNETNQYFALIDIQASTLTSITINPNCKIIANSVFSHCTSLQTVNFGTNSQLQTIGDSAFLNCHSLITITIPETVTSIGRGAFGNCNKLQSITITENINSIGDYAFSGCGGLTEVVIDSQLVYQMLVNSSACGNLLGNTSVTTIKVLKSIIDNGATNEYITSNFTTTSDDGEYYIFSK